MKCIERGLVGLGLLSGATLLFALLLGSGNPMGRPKKVNWREVWVSNSARLISLNEDIKTKRNEKYRISNNDFVDGFPYPFNEGFFIQGNGAIDTSRMLVTYYLDRGTMDHYSAFVYTNDSIEVKKLDAQVRLGANDYQLERNWYIIND